MNKKLKTFLFLHLLLMVYSANAILGKLAGTHPFPSWPFLLLYAGVVALLGVYALGWQQVLKRIPLSVAYANKAVTVIWGCVWGMLFFREHLSPGKAVGGLLVLAGVALYGWADGKAAKE